MLHFKKICICGGGSLAHVLVAVLGRRRDISLRLFTRKPAFWKSKIEINYRNIGALTGTIDVVSDKPAETIAGADLIIITVPSFAYVGLWDLIKPFVASDAILGALPGYGGFEWIVNEHKGTVFGMQRTPYVSRTEVYGEHVFVSGVRDKVFIGTRPAGAAGKLAGALGQLLQLQVLPLPNFLNVSLAPANPIFHSVRNYSLFQQAQGFGKYASHVMFYESWDDTASELFLKCDEEIRHLSQRMPIDLSGIISIRTHYQARNSHDLSAIIRNIESLKGITAPMIRHENYWSTDFGHRFFTEDMLINLFPYIYFGNLIKAGMPVINQLFEWGKAVCSNFGIYPEFDAFPYTIKAGIDSAEAIPLFYA